MIRISDLNSLVAKSSLDFCSSREEELKTANQLYSDGLNFLYGNSVTQNYENAFSLLTECAKLNHVDSIFKLGSCYHLGSGVKKNFVKSAEYFKKSAELGNVFGILNLGYCF
ncbi:hypothetical protein GEMRC1_009872 [Eukaryota sp. GEM-RC1]